MSEKEQKIIQIIINKTNVSKELALKHLERNSFDINLTLKSLEEELYTITERIFRKFKNKGTVLSNVLTAIEIVRGIKRDFWIDFSKLDSLYEKEKAFVIIQEWLNYESWEGFGAALYFHLDIVTDAIRNTLNWAEMADNLQATLQRKTQIYTAYKDKLEWIAIHNEYLIKDIEYQKHEQFFRDNEVFFTEKLYDFVKENIPYFP